MKQYEYIYLIVNNSNGKTYVGKKKFRRKSSTYNNDNYWGSGRAIKRAISKYGKCNFEKFLICYTESEKDACEKEKFWIAHYKTLGKAEYNISLGQGAAIGRKWSKRQREKMMKILKGRTISDETKIKISETLQGRPHSIEQKEKVSSTLSNYYKTHEAHSKGTKWYNNGKICVMAKECPEGFSPGRISWKRG